MDKLKEFGENFEEYLAKEEEEEIARGLARGEEDIREGKVSDWKELKEELRRYIKELETGKKPKLCS